MDGDMWRWKYHGNMSKKIEQKSIHTHWANTLEKIHGINSQRFLGVNLAFAATEFLQKSKTSIGWGQVGVPKNLASFPHTKNELQLYCASQIIWHPFSIMVIFQGKKNNGIESFRQTLIQVYIFSVCRTQRNVSCIYIYIHTLQVYIYIYVYIYIWCIQSIIYYGYKYRGGFLK